MPSSSNCSTGLLELYFGASSSVSDLSLPTTYSPEACLLMTTFTNPFRATIAALLSIPNQGSTNISCVTLDKAMKFVNPPIIIVSNSSMAPGVKSLLMAARSLRCGISVVSPDDSNIKESIDNASHAIFRFGPKSYIKFCNLLVKLTGQPRLDLEKAICAFDKINTYRVLSNAGLPIPKSWVIKRDYLYDGANFIIKIAKGNQGLGVEKIISQESLNDFTNLYIKDDEFLAQEFIPEAKSRDKRLFVIGDRVVAAMERRSVSDDFRANLHLGAVAQAYVPTPLEVDVAIRSIKAFELNYGGVDIIDSNRGPLVLEVNPSPGFGISQITGVDVAKELIKYMMGEKK